MEIDICPRWLLARLRVPQRRQHHVALLVSTLLALGLLPHVIHVPHFCLMQKALGNPLSGVRHFSFDDCAPSPEAGHGVAGKSGRSGSFVSLLLPTRGATDCGHGSANWRSGISSLTARVERGVGKFASGLVCESDLRGLNGGDFLFEMQYVD
jgi:hypothetical protein